MTKFDELVDIIAGNKSKRAEVNESLEIAGAETIKTPLLSCGDHETDSDKRDILYRRAKYKPLMDEGVSYLDET